MSEQARFLLILCVLALGILAGEPSLAPDAHAASPPAANYKIDTTRITQLTGGYDPEGKRFLHLPSPPSQT